VVTVSFETALVGGSNKNLQYLEVNNLQIMIKSYMKIIEKREKNHSVGKMSHKCTFHKLKKKPQPKPQNANFALPVAESSVR